jgi:Na+/proline symporter
MNLHFSLLLGVFVLYTAMLFLVSWITSRKADSNTYFKGNNKSPWFIVAYGMIGASISGVTFISVPGKVLVDNFYYMPLVFGFLVGYAIIALVLLPLYYRMNLTSIYTYLEKRFGFFTYKTGASFFILSRVLGAAVRIFVVVLVLYGFIPREMHVPFWVVAVIFMILIFLYTYKGGVKTIVWTDTLQTTFMILAVIITIVAVSKSLGFGFFEMLGKVVNSDTSNMFNWNWGAGTNALKQFVSGIFITVAMTGLDQEMMQKNLSCRNIKAAQKNMFTTSGIMVVVNYMFLILGAVLAMFVAQQGGLEAMGLSKTDQIFGEIATNYLGIGVALVFAVGLISASYPSAGGALTSLTTSWCIDFVGFNSRTDLTDSDKKRIRYRTHTIFTVIFIAIIVILNIINNTAVIDLVYMIAAYTYGPLLGFFFFGLWTKYQVRDKVMPYIAILSPILCFVLDWVGKHYFGFGFGFTLLIFNGMFTFIGMFLFRRKARA